MTSRTLNFILVYQHTINTKQVHRSVRAWVLWQHQRLVIWKMGNFKFGLHLLQCEISIWQAGQVIKSSMQDQWKPSTAVTTAMDVFFFYYYYCQSEKMSLCKAAFILYTPKLKRNILYYTLCRCCYWRHMWHNRKLQLRDSINYILDLQFTLYTDWFYVFKIKKNEES